MILRLSQSRTAYWRQLPHGNHPPLHILNFPRHARGTGLAEPGRLPGAAEPLPAAGGGVRGGGPALGSDRGGDSAAGERWRSTWRISGSVSALWCDPGDFEFGNL